MHLSRQSWLQYHAFCCDSTLSAYSNTNTVILGLTCNITLHSSCWQPRNKIFFSQKLCTGCTYGINISNKKTIQQAVPKLPGGMLNPKLTHSLTHCWTSCSHAAGDRVNLSWLVGIGKFGMSLPCSDATVFARHDGFYKKKISAAANAHLPA